MVSEQASGALCLVARRVSRYLRERWRSLVGAIFFEGMVCPVRSGEFFRINKLCGARLRRL
jgi:hypothetical protein